MSVACDFKGKYIFTWSIENFFSYFGDKDTKLLGPVFTVEPFKNSKWCVLLSWTYSWTRVRSLTVFLQRSENCPYDGILEVSYNYEVMSSYSKLASSTRTSTKKISKGEQVEIFSCSMNDRNIFAEKSAGDVTTLRFELLSKEKNETRDIECIARTKIDSHQGSFEWKIDEKKFPQFKTFTGFPGIIVDVKVDTKPDDSVNIVMKRTEPTPDSQFLECELSFIDVGGTKGSSKRMAGWFPHNANGWRFNAVVAKNFLKQQCNTNNCITLLCGYRLSKGTLTTELKYIQSDLSPISTIYLLQEDFQRMYMEKILSDVKLRVVDEVFLGHKCVLCSRSPVFFAMFNHDMIENQTSFVDITGTDSKTFALFLKFLYIGETGLTNCDDALNLMLCADRYQVLSLKEYCSSFLMADLCEKNACKILAVADIVGMTLLKASAIRRIGAHASRIFRSASWIQILENHAKLATEVLSILSSELSQ